MACRRSESPFRLPQKKLMFGESVLTTAKRVGGFQEFGESIVTTANHVGSLHNFSEYFLIKKNIMKKKVSLIIYKRREQNI